MSQEMQTIRGIRDLTGSELQTYHRVVEIGSRIAGLYNYKPLLLPMFEYSSVFLRTLGETSDIVTKETYTFSDREKRMVTLRPEFTAAIVRSIISNGLTQTMPQRLFTYGPLFRHERPQQGRHRQFYQFDCELFGNNSPLSDVEVISIMYKILQELELEQKVAIEINTLGDRESNEKYTEALKEYLVQHQDKLSEASQNRLAKNPLRVLDTKEEQDLEVLESAPVISEYLNQDSVDHFNGVCDGLDALNIKYTRNPRLVRGLDYYTHTVFEVIGDCPSAQNAIAAGGRYNNLVEDMGGPSIPSVGFALGIDRIHELLKHSNKLKEIDNSCCYLIPIGENAEQHGISLAETLRDKNIKAVLDHNFSTKKRFKIADRDRVPVCIIFGDDELENSQYTIRNMRNSSEEKIHVEELDEIIAQLLQ